MKRNRGSVVFWIVWLFPLWLNAQTQYVWSAVQSKTQVAQEEALAVEYTCRFSNEAYEYIIVFTPPVETEAYRLVTEGTGEQIIEGMRVNTYRFIVFPKKAGVLTLAFDASMEHTTKASIENSVIGRDNVQKIDYTAKKVNLPVVQATVIAQQSPYAGHLKLQVDVDKKQVPAYTPVQVHVRLEGYGNIDVMRPFTLDIPGANIFTDGPEKKLKLGKNGYEGSIEQQFAIVSDHNFTLPSLQLHYFDTERRDMTTLSTDMQTVTVMPVTAPKQAATDEEASHPDSATGGTVTWIELLMALTAGIAIGRFLLPADPGTEESLPLPKRLKGCKDPRQFVVYLAMLDADKYRNLIDEIEQKLKAGERVDLGSYKRQI